MDVSIVSDVAQCALCGAQDLVEEAGFPALRRVTSDVKPWSAGGRLATCHVCGLVQVPIDAAWLRDIQGIYDGYDVYHVSKGVEQSVFDRSTGEGGRRSARLLARLADVTRLPDRGSMLDIGCGNGAMLAAFGDRFPGWRLFGQDLSERHRSVIEGLPGFAGMFTVPPERIGERFDVVTMIHSLEHFTDPAGALGSALDLLAEDGVLLVEVPDAAVNPFDLLIADHRSHFSRRTLRRLANGTGAEVVSLADDWVAKELSLVVRRGVSGDAVAPPVDADATRRVSAQVQWLNALRTSVEAEAVPFGVFGTAIGATWLFSHCPDKVAFFVDEDPGRAGGVHMGRPVLPPEAVPAGSRVMMPLAPVLAEAVADRLAHLPITLWRMSAPHVR